MPHPEPLTRVGDAEDPSIMGKAGGYLEGDTVGLTDGSDDVPFIVHQIG